MFMSAPPRLSGQCLVSLQGGVSLAISYFHRKSKRRHAALSTHCFLFCSNSCSHLVLAQGAQLNSNASIHLQCPPHCHTFSSSISLPILNPLCCNPVGIQVFMTPGSLGPLICLCDEKQLFPELHTPALSDPSLRQDDGGQYLAHIY